MDKKNPCFLTGYMISDGHLGGTQDHGDPSTWFPEAWDWLVTVYGIKSVLDIGCGMGYSTRYFKELGLDVLGIEGCKEIVEKSFCPENVVLHDFYNEPYNLRRSYDLVWSCEFLEHIDKRYLLNVLQTISDAKPRVLAVTAAPPGAGGHNHVNCQLREYWIEKFEGLGLGLKFSSSANASLLALTKTGTNGREWPYWELGGMIFLR